MLPQNTICARISEEQFMELKKGDRIFVQDGHWGRMPIIDGRDSNLYESTVLEGPKEIGGNVPRIRYRVIDTEVPERIRKPVRILWYNQSYLATFGPK